VLAGAIVLVFCLGWAKLWLVSRRNRKRAVADEEKAAKIQELRISGFIVKSKRENHIPFGVRALESGVEIDGIWVSTTKTPVPESLKQLRDSDHPPESLESINEGRPLSAEELSPPRMSFSGPLQPAFRPSRVFSSHSKSSEAFQPSETKISSRDRASAYKPKRSSHLRFSSYGDIQVNQDTLSQLEGAATLPPENFQHEQSSRRQTAEDSSSDAAADNERSSGTESDSSLTGKGVISEIPQLVRAQSSGAGSKRSRRSKGRTNHDSDDSTSSTGLLSKGEYFRIPPGSPPQAKFNPFATPEVSPNLGSVSMRVTNRPPTDEIEALGESWRPLLSNKQPASPTEPIFKPGTLHLNKAVRKVNSGFEVLPAGTFDLSSGYSRRDSDGVTSPAESVEGINRKRSTKKLQKKGHNSITRKRISGIFGKF
jgi:hypothetical protein